jgi:hypothetical protein
MVKWCAKPGCSFLELSWGAGDAVIACGEVELGPTCRGLHVNLVLSTCAICLKHHICLVSKGSSRGFLSASVFINLPFLIVAVFPPCFRILDVNYGVVLEIHDVAAA